MGFTSFKIIEKKEIKKEWEPGSHGTWRAEEGRPCRPPARRSGGRRTGTACCPPGRCPSTRCTSSPGPPRRKRPGWWGTSSWWATDRSVSDYTINTTIRSLPHLVLVLYDSYNVIHCHAGVLNTELVLEATKFLSNVFICWVLHFYTCFLFFYTVRCKYTNVYKPLQLTRQWNSSSWGWFVQLQITNQHNTQLIVQLLLSINTHRPRCAEGATRSSNLTHTLTHTRLHQGHKVTYHVYLYDYYMKCSGQECGAGSKGPDVLRGDNKPQGTIYYNLLF